MIKLVATDIDGTILALDREFTDGVKECIRKLSDNGIKVVLVTGRMNAAAQLIAKKLNLDTPLVSYQGGLIKEGEHTLYEQYLTEEQASKILKWAKEINIHVNFYNNDILYSESDNEEIKRYASSQNISYVVKSLDTIKKDKVNKILAINYNAPEEIDRYEEELPKIFPELYIVKSSPYFLEFSNKQASKYCAVKFLQKYWGLQDNEILTIGDQNNDIALLEAGGVKVAMGNATDKLKNVADYVTDTVYNDGFVKAIEKFCPQL